MVLITKEMKVQSSVGRVYRPASSASRKGLLEGNSVIESSPRPARALIRLSGRPASPESVPPYRSIEGSATTSMEAVGLSSY